MNDADLVNEWVARFDPGESLFQQSDLDELFGVVPVRAAAFALDRYQEIVAAVPDNVLPLLVLPLEPTLRLVKRPPDVERVICSPWRTLQPPGFYLTAARLWWDWGPGEEYWQSVRSKALPSGLDCFYRCFRDESAQAKGWEYDRAFYIRPAMT